MMMMMTWSHIIIIIITQLLQQRHCGRLGASTDAPMMDSLS